MGLVTIAEGCGKVTEFETRGCKHCQAVIAVLVGVGIKRYEHHRICKRCDGPVCKACSEAMDRSGGECNSPFMAKVENAIKTGKWDEHFTHAYRSCTRG